MSRAKVAANVFRAPEIRQAHSQLKKALKFYKKDQAHQIRQKSIEHENTPCDVIIDVPVGNDLSFDEVPFEKSLLREMLDKKPESRTENDIKELR